MANIFKISDEFLTLINKAEETEGELSEELISEINLSEENLIEKAYNYIGVIKMKEGEVVTLDKEIKRLQALKKKEEKTIEWLSNNLEFAAKTFGIEQVGTNKLKLRKSSSVFVADVNSLPKAYKVTKVTEQADKKAIKEALNAGEEIEGCSIITKETLKIN
jgi:hypothetical protein